MGVVQHRHAQRWEYASEEGGVRWATRTTRSFSLFYSILFSLFLSLRGMMVLHAGHDDASSVSSTHVRPSRLHYFGIWLSCVCCGETCPLVLVRSVSRLRVVDQPRVPHKRHLASSRPCDSTPSPSATVLSFAPYLCVMRCRGVSCGAIQDKDSPTVDVQDFVYDIDFAQRYRTVHL